MLPGNRPFISFEDMHQYTPCAYDVSSLFSRVCKAITIMLFSDLRACQGLVKFYERNVDARDIANGLWNVHHWHSRLYKELQCIVAIFGWTSIPNHLCGGVHSSISACLCLAGRCIQPCERMVCRLHHDGRPLFMHGPWHWWKTRSRLAPRSTPSTNSECARSHGRAKGRGGKPGPWPRPRHVPHAPRKPE